MIPNQNLFRVANEKTTFADAFAMADQVLYSGVACITDLMVKEGLINLDFADVRAIMREMGKAMMGTGEATGEKRAIMAAEAAIANPLLDEVSMKGARGLLISITGGNDLTLYEVDEAASRIRQEVDEEANIILGATFDENLDGIVRVSVVATGIDQPAELRDHATEARISEATNRLRAHAAIRSDLSPRYAALHSTPRPALQAGPSEMHADTSSYGQMQGGRGVQLQPAAPQSHHFVEAPAAPDDEDDGYADGPFIPPMPETPKIRPQRMPQIDDLPLPAQKQIRAQRGEAPAEPAHEVKRRTLLERLAAFGNRHDDQRRSRSDGPPCEPCGAPARSGQPNSIHAEYSKRNAHQRPRHAAAARPAGPHDASAALCRRRSAGNPSFPSPAIELICISPSASHFRAEGSVTAR